MIAFKEDVTERLRTMAYLLDCIASLHNAGIISDEKALEKSNCYLNYIDEVMKIAESELNEQGEGTVQ